MDRIGNTAIKSLHLITCIFIGLSIGLLASAINLFANSDGSWATVQPAILSVLWGAISALGASLVGAISALLKQY